MTTHKAIIRIRPLFPQETAASFSLSPSEIRLQSTTIPLSSATLLPASASQEELYIPISPCIAKVAKGYNAAIIAYGETGSGKTYTLYGPDHRPGVIIRAVRQLFESIRPHLGRGKSYSVVVNNVLVCSERVYDLFGSSQSELQILEAQDGGILIDDLCENMANDVDQCLELIEKGQERREILQRRLPASDCHVILHFKIESRKVCKHGKVRRMNLTFCDMAGSERQVTREASPPAASLLTFHTVISLLALGNVTNLPYQQSKLTTLLQHALHPSSYTCYIHTISPALRSIASSVNSLKFLSKTTAIPMHPVKRRFLASPELSDYLKEEVSNLKDTLSKLVPEQTSLSAVKARPDLMIAEIEELLQMKYDTAQEIASIRRSERAEISTPEPDCEDSSPLQSSASVSHFPRSAESRNISNANVEMHTDFSHTQPNSPIFSFSRSTARSPSNPEPARGSLDQAFDRMVVASIRNKDDKRRKQFEVTSQAAAVARSGGKHSTVSPSPEESELLRARIEAEIRRLEEAKAAQKRRLESRILMEQEERDEFHKILNRRPAIEPRPQRPIRKGSRRLLLG